MLFLVDCETESATLFFLYKDLMKTLHSQVFEVREMSQGDKGGESAGCSIQRNACINRYEINYFFIVFYLIFLINTSYLGRKQKNA